MFDIPSRYVHGGLVLPRSASGPGSSVVGDPSIVWDPEIRSWRMVMFFDPPGHGQAICTNPDHPGPGTWKLLGPLPFANPSAVLGPMTHKPYIVTEAYKPNVAAQVNGQYCLLSVAYRNGQKLVQRAWSPSLAGPWTWESDALIPPGPAGSFDEKHTDAVSGLFFPERQEFLYFYMGYPKVAQRRAISPYGNATGAAVQKVGAPTVTKLGEIIPPCQKAGHWASGYLGGVQLVPGKKHRWVALVNASPTAPEPTDGAIHREEPPPSLGGFAVCDEEFPIKNWKWLDHPIEYIQDIPVDARANGEGVNLWRHHLLILRDGQSAIFYNSGQYGTEQLYVKWSAD